MATRPMMTMRIETYGKAPSRYGKDAYKVGLSEGLLLEQGGWRVVGQGREYVYVQLPEGTSATNVTLTLPVPTDAEIEHLAMEMHRQGTLQRRVVDGFIVMYYPVRDGLEISLDFGAMLQGQRKIEHVKRSPEPAVLDFGWRAPWCVTLTWNDGPEHAPTWERRGEA